MISAIFLHILYNKKTKLFIIDTSHYSDCDVCYIMMFASGLFSMLRDENKSISHKDKDSVIVKERKPKKSLGVHMIERLKMIT